MSDTSDVLLSIVEKVSGLPSSTSRLPFLGDFLLPNKKEKQVITERDTKDAFLCQTVNNLFKWKHFQDLPTQPVNIHITLDA